MVHFAKVFAVSALMLGGAALACERGESAGDSGAASAQVAAVNAEGTPAGAVTPGPGEPAAAAATQAQSKFDESAFSLGITAGDVAVGKEAQALIRLEAKGEYKVNAEYPFKFKPQKSEGVAFGSDVIGKDAVKLEKKSAVMTVPFTVKSAGEQKVTGQFAFSVCTDERCLIEKRNLELVVNAK